MSEPAPARTARASTSTARPRRDAIPTAVITVSDTRTLETDTGGALVVSFLEEAGHPVRSCGGSLPTTWRRSGRPSQQALGEASLGAVILTGGTGVAPRDVTPEAVTPLLDRMLPGFGELFRMLSYEEIGAAALLSRALAGQKDGRVIFALPGSRGAIRLAMEKLVIPELGHLVGESVKAGWAIRRGQARAERQAGSGAWSKGLPMRLLPSPGAGLVLAPGLLAAPILPARAADLHVWVDDSGLTHFTNDGRKGARWRCARPSRLALTGLWDEGVVGTPLFTRAADRGGEEARTRRTLRIAVADLQRGDDAQARQALEGGAAPRAQPARGALLSRVRSKAAAAAWPRPRSTCASSWPRPATSSSRGAPRPCVAWSISTTSAG